MIILATSMAQKKIQWLSCFTRSAYSEILRPVCAIHSSKESYWQQGPKVHRREKTIASRLPPKHLKPPVPMEVRRISRLCQKSESGSILAVKDNSVETCRKRSNKEVWDYSLEAGRRSSALHRAMWGHDWERHDGLPSTNRRIRYQKPALSQGLITYIQRSLRIELKKNGC